MPAIETHALTKRYGTTTAVDDLTFDVPDGVVYGFLGPNGAGKTTTMRMLTGLTRPTGGSATVADVSITDRDGLRPHIGYLPEEPPLYEQATAHEQLEYVAGLRDLPDDLARTLLAGLFGYLPAFVLGLVGGPQGLTTWFGTVGASVQATGIGQLRLVAGGLLILAGALVAGGLYRYAVRRFDRYDPT